MNTKYYMVDVIHSDGREEKNRVVAVGKWEHVSEVPGGKLWDIFSSQEDLEVVKSEATTDYNWWLANVRELETEEPDNTCDACRGTGEGEHEFSRCNICRGKGVVR